MDDYKQIFSSGEFPFHENNREEDYSFPKEHEQESTSSCQDPSLEENPFDRFMHNSNLKMLEAALPYVGNASRKPLAFYIKFMEMSRILQDLDREDVLTACGFERRPPNPEAMLHAMKMAAGRSANPQIDQLLNVMNMMRTYQNFNEMMQKNPEMANFISMMMNQNQGRDMSSMAARIMNQNMTSDMMAKLSQNINPDMLSKLSQNMNPDMLSKLSQNMNPDMLSKLSQNINPDMLSKLSQNMNPDMLSRLGQGMSPDMMAMLSQMMNGNDFS